MFFDNILVLFSEYLINIMFVCLVVALVFRWLAYKASMYDQVYFLTFARELDKKLEQSRRPTSQQSIADYIDHILDQVLENLPVRSLRFSSEDSSRKETMFGAKKIVSVRNYLSGKSTIVHGIRKEINAFKNHFPPKYDDLTKRILSQDDHWENLFGIFSIDKVSSMIDIMPRIFVVMGIFGTFIGISFALPEIVKIDFNNLQGSSDILKGFVLHVTFAMKTSIAGILFSLILTVLNTLFPISTVRKSIFKKLENSLEHLWLTLHNEKDYLALIYKEIHSLKNKYSLKKSA